VNTCGTCAEDERALKDLFENVEIMKMMNKALKDLFENVEIMKMMNKL
jgi:hypothetical protein